jgi:RNA polymerase sigma factor (sigma-70 family)
VAGYVTRRIACQADAEDVVHDTFLRAVREAGDYQPEQGYPVRAWLCGLAAWQLRDYTRNDRWPYLAAVDATRDAMTRPVTETAERRDTRPLSEPVRAAVARLNPAEQRAVQLRYLEGLSGKDAAERAGCTVSSIGTNAMTARRKLAWMLADRAPTARSPLQDMPPGHAVQVALSVIGPDRESSAVLAWLRERGVRVSKSTVNNVRNRGPQPDAGRDTTPDHLAPADQQAVHTAAAPDTPVSATIDGNGLRELPGRRRPGTAPVLRDRARAASHDYRDRHGRLPSISELAEAAQVSQTTAAKALREVAGPRSAGMAPRLRDQTDAAIRDYRDRHGRLPTGSELAEAAQVGPTTARRVLRELNAPSDLLQPAARLVPAAHGESAGRHRPRGAHLRDVPAHDPSPPGRRVAADVGTHRHPVRAHSQLAHTAPRAHGGNAAHDNGDQSRDGGDAAIRQARIAVDVLTAHRTQQQQRETEQARSEQLNRWHHDDQLARTAGRAHGWGMDR